MNPDLSSAIAQLSAAGCDSPKREARLLWEHADNDFALFHSLLQRRCKREPLAQILGKRAFWSLDFYVNMHTLTPRPDSETVVEAALALLPDRDLPYHLLDLGTGSGCLLLSLLHELPNAMGFGIDSSREALAVAARNANNLKLDARAKFAQGNWAQGINDIFDMVISNPPYIPHGEIARLMPEVRDYEPHSALDGGVDGLEDYRRITLALPQLLKTGGHAVLELGIGQAEAVRALGITAGLSHHATRNDLNGIPRAIIFSQ